MTQSPNPNGRLTTHALDVARGRPAAGLRIDLAALDAEDRRRPLVSATTNAEGRTDAPLLAGENLAVGRYELHFHVGAYLAALGRRGSAGRPAAESAPGSAGAPAVESAGGPAAAALPFLDVVPVRFAVAEAGAHYHVPLLFTPWSYTTYRGS